MIAISWDILKIWRSRRIFEVETLGYYQPSLRDDEWQILATLDWKVRAPFCFLESAVLLGVCTSDFYRQRVCSALSVGQLHL